MHIEHLSPLHFQIALPSPPLPPLVSLPFPSPPLLFSSIVVTKDSPVVRYMSDKSGSVKISISHIIFLEALKYSVSQ